MYTVQHQKFPNTVAQMQSSFRNTADQSYKAKSGVELNLWIPAEMGIYRDNLSAIVIGDNFLSIIVIAQNSLDLSITVIAFVIYSVIADKLSR